MRRPLSRASSCPKRLALAACVWLACASGHSLADKLAIIIDDVGYNRELGERTARLPGEYTLALLPGTPHSQHLAQLAHRHHKELMLHIPMANTAGLALGAGALELGMERRELLLSLQRSLDELPRVVGLNNHMGSALTPMPGPMGWVMSEAARRELYFIDSRTTAASVAHRVAQAYGLKSAERDVFLDHVRDGEAIRAQLERAIALAKARGRAIAIGHPYPETLQVLESAQSLLQQVELVPASALVSRRAAGTLACPAPPLMLRQPLARRTLPAHTPVHSTSFIEKSYQLYLPVVEYDINNPG